MYTPLTMLVLVHSCAKEFKPFLASHSGLALENRCSMFRRPTKRQKVA